MDKLAAVTSFLDKIKAENDGKHIDFVLPGYAAKRLIAYQSMREDILLCLNCIERLHSKNDEVITLTLYHTMIILYGKCFSDAASSKSPKLEIKDCFPDATSQLFLTHKDIIDLRHNFTAHRGSTENEMSFAYLKLNIEDNSRQVKVKQLKRRMPKAADFPNYHNLFSHIRQIIEDKFLKEANKVWTHMLENYAPEELARLKIAGPTKGQ